MKSKIILIVIVVIAIALVTTGTVFILSSKTEENKNNLRKIEEEEISHEVAEEIVKFYLEENPIKDVIKVKEARVLANNLEGEYLVRMTLDDEENTEKETTLKYLGNGKWEMEYPLKSTSGIDEKFTEFWPVVDEG